MVAFATSTFTFKFTAMIKKTVNASEKHAEPASFEAAMAELTALVARMEAGELALEASVTSYARGAQLVQYCAAQLEKVEQQVKILDGEMLKPFQADSDPA